MKKWSVIGILVLLVLGFKTFNTRLVRQEEIKLAVSKSLPLLQRSSHTFLENAGGCHSCHGQGLGAVVFALAEEKGFALQDTLVKEAINSIMETWQSRKAEFSQHEDPVAIVMSGGYDFWAWRATRSPQSNTTALLARNIMQRQHSNGSWVSPNARPPLEYYAFSATALSLKGLDNYLPGILQEEWKLRKEKAIQWLSQTVPRANEEKVFQLLGLSWTKAKPEFIKQQAAKLLAAQHPGGGWSQLDSLSPDAYATGQSLYALQQCGYLSVDAAAYQKGLSFLLNTQHADGSWDVQTRSFPSVPYVDSGFPHGDNQFIAAAGSNWATLALLLAVDGKK